MIMNRKVILVCAAAISGVLLSGCSTPSSSSRQEASGTFNRPHQEREYIAKISRANNIAWAFGFGVFGESNAPSGKSITKDGSLALDTAVWAGNLHSAANSAILPGTSSWGAAAGIGLGIGLLSAALGPSDMKSQSSLVGYLPKEAAKDKYEARLMMLEKFSKAVQKSLKAQYPDAEFHIKRDDDDSVTYVYSIELKSAKLNCKFSEEAGRYDIYNPCKIRMFAVESIGQPGMTAPMFGKQFDAWRFFAQTIKVDFLGGKDINQGLNWAKAMAAIAPYMPENQFLYVTTLEGPRPNREKNPPFIVEKDKVDFFVRVSD